MAVVLFAVSQAPSSFWKMSRPDNLLFHSRIEICRILKVLVQEHSVVFAQIGKERLFKSQMLSVDPGNDHFCITYSTDKLANSLLLKILLVELTVTDRQGLSFTFDVAAPEETQAGGVPAIQFALPKTLLMHSRREHPRLTVPTDISLRCIADAAGVLPFETHVIDISHDGLGCLVYDPDIILEKGDMLKSCRIIMPDGDVVIADIELRYTIPITLADGSLARRAGFRFIQRPDGIAKLIALFIQNLDKK